MVLPFIVFLIRFDRLVANEKDPNAVNPDLLFKNINWIPFRANLWKRLHLVSIGVLEGSFQSYDYNTLVTIGPLEESQNALTL